VEQSFNIFMAGSDVDPYPATDEGILEMYPALASSPTFPNVATRSS